MSDTEIELSDTLTGYVEDIENRIDQKLGARSSNATTNAAKVVNIAYLNGEQLFAILQNYVNSMTTFASQIRNVYKEKEKENLEKTGKVYAQYVKVKSA